MYTVDHLQAQHTETMQRLSKDQERSANKLKFQLDELNDAFSELNKVVLTSLSNAAPTNIKLPRVGGFFSQLKGLFL